MISNCMGCVSMQSEISRRAARCICRWGWFLLWMFMLGPTWADEAATTQDALDHFQKGEEAFHKEDFDAALAQYEKALLLIDRDGPLVLGKNRTERSVSTGRFADRVTTEEIERADYRPNQRIEEIKTMRFEAQRRAKPPKLKLHWVTLSEPTQDSILDGGEKGVIVVNVENTGQSSAMDGYLDIALNDSQGLVYEKRVDLGEVAAGQSVSANVQIEAARNVTASNRQVSVRARDRAGFVSNMLDIVLPTRPHEPAQVAVSDIQLQDLTGDSLIDPLETVFVRAVVVNVGKGASNALLARLDLGKGVFYGPEQGEPIDLGVLYPGQSRPVEFSFLTNASFGDGQKIPVTLRVVDRDDNRHAERDVNAYIHAPAAALTAARASADRSAEVIDVDVKLPRGVVPNPDAVAVVIGNRSYRKAGLPDVKYAHNDARVIKEYLVRTLGFDEANILYVEDATAAVFNEIFGNSERHTGRLFSYVKPDVSEVFVYYSGHGAPDISSANAFFVPVDADPSYVAISGYPLELLYRNLGKLPARRFTIVLDTCFSGNSDGGPLLGNVSPASIRVKDAEGKLDNAAIFTSTRPQQVSAWYHEKRHGLFTYYFLKGLSGAADADKDRQITSTELGNYVTLEVAHQARRKYGLEQNPVLLEKQSTVLTQLGE